jgi:hypothetical protein
VRTTVQVHTLIGVTCTPPPSPPTLPWDWPLHTGGAAATHHPVHSLRSVPYKMSRIPVFPPFFDPFKLPRSP